MRLTRIALTLLLLAGASGCGQKGPLYLPGDASVAGNESQTESATTPEAETQLP